MGTVLEADRLQWLPVSRPMQRRSLRLLLKHQHHYLHSHPWTLRIPSDFWPLCPLCGVKCTADKRSLPLPQACPKPNVQTMKIREFASWELSALTATARECLYRRILNTTQTSRRLQCRRAEIARQPTVFSAVNLLGLLSHNLEVRMRQTRLWSNKFRRIA